MWFLLSDNLEVTACHRNAHLRTCYTAAYNNERQVQAACTRCCNCMVATAGCNCSRLANWNSSQTVSRQQVGHQSFIIIISNIQLNVTVYVCNNWVWKSVVICHYVLSRHSTPLHCTPHLLLSHHVARRVVIHRHSQRFIDNIERQSLRDIIKVVINYNYAYFTSMQCS